VGWGCCVEDDGVVGVSDWLPGPDPTATGADRKRKIGVDGGNSIRATNGEEERLSPRRKGGGWRG